MCTLFCRRLQCFARPVATQHACLTAWLAGWLPGRRSLMKWVAFWWLSFQFIVATLLCFGWCCLLHKCLSVCVCACVHSCLWHARRLERSQSKLATHIYIAYLCKHSHCFWFFIRLPSLLCCELFWLSLRSSAPALYCSCHTTDSASTLLADNAFNLRFPLAWIVKCCTFMRHTYCAALVATGVCEAPFMFAFVACHCL